MNKHTGLTTFIGSVLAGFCIALGGTVFLRLKDAFTGGNVVGAFLFCIGLLVICTRGYNLYTGKACYLLNQKNKGTYVLYLVVVWLGNLCGTCLLAGIELLTGIGSSVSAAAQPLVAGKLSAPLLSLFLLGIICNVCIFIAADGYKNCQHEVGKYLSLILGVVVFILCGTEHSIADMYYFAVSGTMVTQAGPVFLRLLVITLGNLVGGIFFPGLELLNKKLNEKAQV